MLSFYCLNWLCLSKTSSSWPVEWFCMIEGTITPDGLSILILPLLLSLTLKINQTTLLNMSHLVTFPLYPSPLQTDKKLCNFSCKSEVKGWFCDGRRLRCLWLCTCALSSVFVTCIVFWLSHSCLWPTRSILWTVFQLYLQLLISLVLSLVQFLLSNASQNL